VLWSPFPQKTYLRCPNIDDFVLLKRVFAQLETECVHLVFSEENEFGILIVGHHEDLDPVALAELLGVPQDEENDDEQVDVFEETPDRQPQKDGGSIAPPDP
jgi:hypothetical protein